VRISEIAFAAGFQSLSQFNRVFRKFSGKSPTQFRAAKHVVRRAR
jgi:AraC-like DNA-binding protein